MKTTIFILILLASTKTMASDQWLCKDASSQRSGNIIMACGVGKSVNLETARASAREEAVNEFNRVCALSSDCRTYDYNVIPMRTDCSIEGSQNVCYRAIQFEITDKKRSDIYVDTDQIETDLQNHQAEVFKLQQTVDRLHQLEQTKAEENALKEQLKAEGSEIKLEELASQTPAVSKGYQYTHLLYDNSFKFGLKYWDAKLTSSSEVDLALNVSYEYRPQHWLGLELNYAHGGDISSAQSENSVPHTGAANTTQNFNGTGQFNEFGAAALIYLPSHGLYLKTEAGMVLASRQNLSVQYGQLSTGTVNKTNKTVDTSYTGLSIGIDSRNERKGFGVFAELGARRTTDDGHVGPIAQIGLNYGF